MSAVPSTSASHSDFAHVLNAALETYKVKTKKDPAMHPLFPRLESCGSPEAILNVLQEQIPASSQSRNGDNGLTKWVTPTVNILYSFSAALGEVAGLAFPPANIIFTGIGILLLTAKDASASHDKFTVLFNRIEHFFHRLEIYTGITPTTAMTNIIVEIMAEVLIILGIVTKEAKRGRLKRYFRKLAGNRDIEDSMQRLNNLTLEEAWMASAELLRVTHGISSEVQEANRNQLRDSLLRWLSPSDPSVNHNAASKAQHKGTAQWFLQGNIFNQWKSTGSFLWIHGKPGSGKSILCSSIIQDIMALRDAGTASIAYFYFDLGDVERQTLHNLLPSLLIQLSAWSDPCCDILFRLYSANGRGAQKPGDRTMVECLKEMLILGAQRPTYIILDALDECPKTSTIPPPQEEVLKLVDELVGLELRNLHICVTSRPELDIQAVLEPLTARPVSLHDESGQQEDIAKYVTSVVGSDRRTRRWRKEDRDLVIKTLTGKADGMFRWAFCQLEILLDCPPPSVRHTLGELPVSLDKTYERILREIRTPNQRHAHRLMQCLVAAVRPLEVKELAEVLAFNFDAQGIPRPNSNWRWEDQEGAVMSACSSLVTIVKDGDSRIVQFSHFSVKEFLTTDRLAEPMRDVSRYHIELEAAHTILAQACLDVLLRLDDHVDRNNIKDFPLARYAAEYWPRHVTFGSMSARIKDGMKCLFDEDKPHFATWLWIYNEWDGRRMSTMRPGKPGVAPLYHAAWHGFRDLAEDLIAEHPEHINAGDEDGFAATHIVARKGHVDILALLLEHGADVDSRTVYNQTPLFWAAVYGEVDVGQYLLDYGADINARNNFHATPLYAAAREGRIGFVGMLLERGARIDVEDDEGRTPLHHAVERGKTQTARLLLEHGASVYARDNSGRTPSQVLDRQANSGVPPSHVMTMRREFVELFSRYRAESLQ